MAVALALSNLPTGAQLRAARARVISDFSSARLKATAREYLHALYRSASALRLVWRAHATTRLKPHSLFDDPIFERVKRNDHQPSIRFERVYSVGDKSIQPFEFAIDRDAK